MSDIEEGEYTGHDGQLQTYGGMNVSHNLPVASYFQDIPFQLPSLQGRMDWQQPEMSAYDGFSAPSVPARNGRPFIPPNPHDILHYDEMSTGRQNTVGGRQSATSQTEMASSYLTKQGNLEQRSPHLKNPKVSSLRCCSFYSDLESNNRAIKLVHSTIATILRA